MNKVVIATLSFAAGLAAGLAIGYHVQVEQERELKAWNDDLERSSKELEKKVLEDAKREVDPAEFEYPREDDDYDVEPDDPDDLLSRGPAHIAKPSQPGVNYAKVQQIVKEQGYTTPEEIAEVVDDPNNAETFEEREEREMLETTLALNEYREKNKGKIVPIPRDKFESDFMDVDYEKKDLYYFTTDDVLTDEDGNHVNEEEFIGTRPRHFGWMSNDDECIYIRNNPKETDYKVWKEKCASSDWWS